MARTTRLNLHRFPNALPGEDRTYGGDQFYVDLVPRSVWFANLRAMMPPSHWKTLSSYVIARAGRTCEICHSQERLEAHERWHFDLEHRVQRLLRLMCVCKLCHLSIHSGMAEVLGLRQEIEQHIFRITLWGVREMKKHLKEAGRRWAELSGIAWDLDVSIAVNAGITLYSREELWRRVDAKKRQVAAQIDQAHLMIAGERWDFSTELAQNCVVFLALTDQESLGGIPAFYETGVCYCIKDPKLICSSRATLDLKKFLQAFRNPYGVSSGDEIEIVLNEDSGPRRLVLVDGIKLSDEMVERGLRSSVIFSFG